MAIFDYKCERGCVTTNRFTGLPAPEFIDCAKCWTELGEKVPSRRQITAPSVHFPGTNFSRSSVGAKTK